MAVLFDLDQTLLDSSLAEPLRSRRLWSEVYSLIPKFRPYRGISELLAFLSRNGVPVCVVTSSPKAYCVRVLSYWHLEVDATVCYHDTEHHKPCPDPLLAALSRLGIRAPDAISVGDSPEDIIAARRAGIFAVAAGWGTADARALADS